jgi:hypothetical protein
METVWNEGATGADLREVVTRAVLRSADGHELSTDMLIRLARDCGYRPAAGQYL